MSHPYDASTKYLLEVRLADWLPLCGRTTNAPVEIVDAEVSTVTAAADRVLRVAEDEPWLLHVELQSSRDPVLPDRVHVYNTLIGWRHGLPVRSLAVLLRPAADGPELTGAWEQGFRDETPYLVFRYQVVRIWQLPTETFLAGGLGLRYSRELVSRLLRGVRAMKESVTYQAIVEEGVEKGKLEGKLEGRLEEARTMLLEFGAERFGTPGQEVETAIGRITDVERLRRLGRRLLHVSSWQELLATP
jgi:predicted transposase YdaD